MTLDITKTQIYKIHKLLTEYEQLTASQIVRFTGFPEPSVRRVLSELNQIGRIEKGFIYKLKDKRS